MVARAVEAACWMAGREHDYAEQIAAGLKPKAVQDKYYFARRPEITRVVDISRQIDTKIEVNRANVAKGPGGHWVPGCAPNWRSTIRSCRCWATTTPARTATTSSEFVMRRSRELGQRYGVEYAEAFHYIPAGCRRSRPRSAHRHLYQGTRRPGEMKLAAPLVVMTIGHSTRPAKEFIHLLKAHERTATGRCTHRPAFAAQSAVQPKRIVTCPAFRPPSLPLHARSGWLPACAPRLRQYRMA